MLDDTQRQNVALKKFALIAPVLNGQVANQEEYFHKLAAELVEVPGYGPRKYSPKTFRWWLASYRLGGLEALKPGYRSDRGKSRRVNEEIAARIQAKRAANPGLAGTLLYDELLAEGVFTPDKLSLATFYRFLSQNPDLARGHDAEAEEKESKRFSHQWVNELWQTDIMYGPYLKTGRAKRQTYLIAFIDDASRLITHAEFCWEQNFTAIRTVFKEAVLKRGVPKMLYTDNGKVYRSGQLAFLCASLGCILLHTQPFSPAAKGKVERFFKTARMRFLSRVQSDQVNSMEELNRRFWQWLEEDYQRKLHSALDMSPLDYFLSQADRVKIFADPALLDECFLLRTSRKVHHDATFSLENVLYETAPKFANTRLEIRYEPEWLSNPARPVFLYHEGLKVGEARQVDFAANAYLKRRGPGRPPGKKDSPQDEPPGRPATKDPQTSVSFASMLATNGSGEGEG